MVNVALDVVGRVVIVGDHSLTLAAATSSSWWHHLVSLVESTTLVHEGAPLDLKTQPWPRSSGKHKVELPVTGHCV
jgi:hypothetical protein